MQEKVLNIKKNGLAMLLLILLATRRESGSW